VLEAAGWGFVGGSALLLGAVFGLVLSVPRRAIGAIMGFGAGVLISAVAFELTQESFERGGTAALGIGLALGALTFWAADWVVDHRGGAERKRADGQPSDGSPGALVIGALLDGIPESVAIGASLLEGGGVGLAVVAAVFLSNVPEAMSASTGMKKAGRSAAYVLALWLTVAVASAAAAGLGYALLGGAPPAVLAFILAFAGGAILTMLADTMMPEAFEDSGSWVGLLTVLGFALAFLLSTAE
jgi:ZIP family zinc transporter